MVSKFIISGGRKLEGKVKVAGSKNAALALIPASLLGSSVTTFTNVPIIRDVQVMAEIVQKLGGKVEGIGTDTLTIDPSSISSYELDPALSARVRASVIFAAPLLVRFGKVLITPPGGDQIGERLLETHFSMMRELGVEIKQLDGKYLLSWKKRKAKTIFMDEASVTATEMGLIMGSLLNESTIIEDAAGEPHVNDLAELLNRMGADIKGGGTNRLEIKGANKLRGTEHKVVADHIDGSTFAIAAAITGGKVVLEDCPEEHYRMIINYLKSMGVDVSCRRNNIYVNPSQLVSKKRKFQTRPWPGFPTDLMSPFIVLATQTKGTVLCHDWMYEWRVFFVDDLISMGAKIFIADPHRVIVEGPSKLHAEKLYCKDIRAGISIILAALIAEGKSEVDNIEVAERGYEKIEERFESLGAKIKRVDSHAEKS